MRLSLMLEELLARRSGWSFFLTPFSWIFYVLVAARRVFQTKINSNPPLAVPVVIVGNITIGGTGKTPLVISITRWLKEKGYNPGIVSRGYGGNSSHYPLLVNLDSKAEMVGDEPLLLAKICPVVVDPDRYRAANFLLEKTNCNLIISDDGLQHYKLPRDLEIAVVNGKKKFGNEKLLPAGPLREPLGRLKEVDFILINSNSSDIKKEPKQDIKDCLKNGIFFTTKAIQLKHLVSGETYPIIESSGLRGTINQRIKDWHFNHKIHAVAGIADPQRFFDTLDGLGFSSILHSYPDHHSFTGEEFIFDDDLLVVITAKDAVKCKSIINDKIWVLEVEAAPDPIFLKNLLGKLHEIKCLSH